MRYVVVGPGAVGGTIGGRLAQHGHDVAFVARGAHAEALQKDGLLLRDPDGEVRLPVPTVTSPPQVDWRADDVVVLAVKTQDTAGVLRSLVATAPSTVTIVCAQNGVENERMALRCFDRVVAMCVMLPATHLQPGVVDANSAPVSGILDVGRYPTGTGDVVEQIAADLGASTFSSQPQPAVMRFKYAKLLMNLGNAVEAACGRADGAAELSRRARSEGAAVMRAAGIDVASQEEDAARRGNLMSIRPVGGAPRGGGSSWQSLARGTGAIEADYLNGEIVLLGRIHGVATPVNAALQRVANELAASGGEPGSVSVAEVERLAT